MTTITYPATQITPTSARLNGWTDHPSGGVYFFYSEVYADVVNETADFTAGGLAAGKAFSEIVSLFSESTYYFKAAYDPPF